MERISLTSFGRQTVSAGLIATLSTHAEADADPVSKWEVLRDVTTARKALGLSDRALTVLTALLSFHKGEELVPGKPLIVFPSNRTLSARAHGMAESTLRRHLAALVEAGLIHRHDSPNGKRYTRRGPGGVLMTAFGFDLSPLVVRAQEIAASAEQVRAEELALTVARERCVLMLRDATKLIEFGRGQGLEMPSEEVLDECRKHLRRKPTFDVLNSVEMVLDTVLEEIKLQFEIAPDTEKASVCDNRNERHQQKSDPEDLDSDSARRERQNANDPSIPLSVVLEACSEFQHYCPDGISGWRDLAWNAEKIGRMMGISEDAWKDAIMAMGAANASVAVACILERMGEIVSPGGYLRALTRKAGEGKFAVSSMVSAILNMKEARVA